MTDKTTPQEKPSGQEHPGAAAASGASPTQQNQPTPPAPPSTPSIEAIELVYAHFASTACQLLKSEGQVTPALFFLRLEPGETKPSNFAGQHPMLTQQLMNAVPGKMILGQYMREVLEPGSPVQKQFESESGFAPNLLVHLAEAWQTVLTKEEHAEDKHKAPSKSPERTEAIMVALHTWSKMHLGMQPITRDANGAPSATLVKLEHNSALSSRFGPVTEEPLDTGPAKDLLEKIRRGSAGRHNKP